MKEFKEIKTVEKIDLPIEAIIAGVLKGLRRTGVDKELIILARGRKKQMKKQAKILAKDLETKLNLQNETIRNQVALIKMLQEQVKANIEGRVEDTATVYDVTDWVNIAQDLNDMINDLIPKNEK